MSGLGFTQDLETDRATATVCIVPQNREAKTRINGRRKARRFGEVHTERVKMAPRGEPHLEVWREVPVGFVFVCFVQVVLGERQDEVIAAVCLLRGLKNLPFPRQAPVLHLLKVLLRPRDEEGVHPKVEHLILTDKSAGSLYSHASHVQQKIMLKKKKSAIGKMAKQK